MLAHEFVITRIEEHKAFQSLKSIAEKVGASENTLRYSVQDGTAKPSTLVDIIAGLDGMEAASQFLITYKNALPGLEVSNAISRLAKPSIDDASLAVDRNTQEVLMYTGAQYGIAKKDLLKVLPHRAALVEELIGKNIISEKAGILKSSHSSIDPDLAVKKIMTKADVLSHNGDQLRSGKSFTADEKVDVLGFMKLMNLATTFAEEYFKIKEEHATTDGVHFSLGLFISSLGLSPENKAEILKMQNKTLPNNEGAELC